MSDKFNIEELFRSNLGSLEGEVSPNAWSNIQQGLQTQSVITAATKAGLSSWLKSMIIGGSIVSATVVGVYLMNNNQSETVGNDAVLAVNEERTNNGITVAENNGGTVINSVIEEVELDQQRESFEGQTNTRETPSIFQGSSRVSDSLGSVTSNFKPNGVDGVTDKELNEDATFTAIGEVEPVTSSEVIDEAPNDPIQKQIEINPTFTALTNNQAPAAFEFVSNAKNCSKIRWDFGDGTTAEGFDVEHTFNEPGIYKVQIIGTSGQQNRMKTIMVNVESIAKINEKKTNIFSPNGDDINDNYFIESENLVSLVIMVTDSNGQIVWSSEEIDFKWNGRDLGDNALAAGSYSYSLVAYGTDGGKLLRSGTIEIIR